MIIILFLYFTKNFIYTKLKKLILLYCESANSKNNLESEKNEEDDEI
jgi:hypothetical protein